jgi:P27 family predicted phage terminase small subunit
MSKNPPAPSHLREHTRRWYRSVVRDYQLEPHHLKLLQVAAECWDRLCQAREQIAKDGLVVVGSEGALKAHPAVAIERDCRLAFARLIRELDLDVEAPAATRSAPPPLRSNNGGR